MKPRADKFCITAAAARRDRYIAAVLGASAGVVVSLLAVFVVELVLHDWRTENHERLTAEAVAAVDKRLGGELKDCKKDVARFQEIADMEKAYAERRSE